MKKYGFFQLSFFKILVIQTWIRIRIDLKCYVDPYGSGYIDPIEAESASLLRSTNTPVPVFMAGGGGGNALLSHWSYCFSLMLLVWVIFLHIIIRFFLTFYLMSPSLFRCHTLGLRVRVPVGTYLKKWEDMGTKEDYRYCTEGDELCDSLIRYLSLHYCS